MKGLHVAVAAAVLAVAFVVYKSAAPPPAAPEARPAVSGGSPAAAAAEVERWVVVERTPDRPGPASLTAPKVREVLIAPSGDVLAIPERHWPFFAAIEEGQEVTDPPRSMRLWRRTGHVRDADAGEFARLREGGSVRGTLFDEPYLFRGITFYVVP